MADRNTMSLTQLLIEKLAMPLATLLIRSVAGETAGQVGGGLLSIAQRLASDRYEQRELARHFERIGERVVQRLEPRIEEAIAQSDIDADKIASAVGWVLDRDGSASALLQYNMQPDRLADAWRATHPDRWNDFNTDERRIFNTALDETARYLVEIAAELPGFQSRFAALVVQELGSLVEDLDRVLDRVDCMEAWLIDRGRGGESDRFEADYRRAVIRRFDYMELLGADIPAEARRHPLSIAYVSITLLAAEDGDGPADDETGAGVSQSFEELLDELHGKDRRLLIRGEAGSGKSTLLRWAGLQAAKPGEDGEATSAGWRECIPFLIRLRDYPLGKLPSVFELPGAVAKNVGAPPEGWVRQLLESGRALLLFDGVDEVPNDRREDVRREIEEIIRAFPGNFFLVSTRPAAVPENWLASLVFREARINPMSDADRNRFIEKWHAAVAEQLRRDRRKTDEDELPALAESLIRQLRDNPPVARLATNPLLCGMVCALHRQRQQQLPETQVELCEDLCKMLLHQREKESRLDTQLLSPTYARLSYPQKRALVQELAHYMVRNGQSSVPVVQADVCLAEALGRFPKSQQVEAGIVRQVFVERSGLLREPEPGRLDFIHNTLKEYLAGDRFAALGDEGQLVDHALDPAWQPSILFAAGSAIPGFADRLIDRLLAATDAPLARVARFFGGVDAARATRLFAVRCGGDALHLSAQNRQRLNAILEDSNRPLSVSESESFAALGDFVVPYLTYDSKLAARTLLACVRTLRLIGTEAAEACLNDYRSERRATVVSELKQVLDPLELVVVQEGLLPIVELDPEVKQRLEQTSPVEVMRGLNKLTIHRPPPIDLAPLAELPELKRVHVHGLLPESIESLAKLASLERLRGNVYAVNSIGTDLVPIPAGTFLMGSPASDRGVTSDERPQHRVRITHPFLMGAYPVTQREYQQVMGTNPSHFRDDDRLPVESVSWFDAVNFCNRLSEIEGFEPHYEIDGERVSSRGGLGYRLPTEAEWEFACRAGTTTRWCCATIRSN
jgi:hypothetical protein